MWVLLNNNLENNLLMDNKNTRLIDISKITFFVGKNNSGKSFLMREILKKAKKVYLNTEDVKKEMIECVENIYEYNYYNYIKNEKIINIRDDYKKLDSLLNDIIRTRNETGKRIGNHSVREHKYDNELIATGKEKLFEVININKEYEVSLDNNIRDDFDLDDYQGKIIDKFQEELKQIINDSSDKELPDYYELLNNIIENEKLNKFYFPVNRTIRNPLKITNKKDSTENDIYYERLKYEYNFGEDINVITGLNFYNDYKRSLLGSKEKREKVAEFEKFISEYFFENKPIAIIPDEDTSELKVNINNGEDRYIFEVGDGITSLMILMYTIFMEYDDKNARLFFIEEPENNFHPGYQKLFINMIKSYKKFKNCYFIITTHSNHLIDTGINGNDTSIYLLKKENEEIHANKESNDNIDILEELGVDLTSVMIANKAIWVEGKYDALYIRKLLNLKYIKDNVSKEKYIEDYNYCFIPYGGANMTLIDFNIENEEEQDKQVEDFICKAKKINPNFMVILDDDAMYEEEKQAKIANYEKLLASLGEEKVYKHNVREIENYFGEEIIKEFVKQNVKEEYGSKEYIDKLNINFEEYKKESLGSYINRKITENIIKDNTELNLKAITGRKNGFEDGSALFNKQKFYNVVCEFFEKEDFSYEGNIGEEAKKLIDNIERFIK